MGARGLEMPPVLDLAAGEDFSTRDCPRGVFSNASALRERLSLEETVVGRRTTLSVSKRKNVEGVTKSVGTDLEQTYDTAERGRGS